MISSILLAKQLPGTPSEVERFTELFHRKDFAFTQTPEFRENCNQAEDALMMHCFLQDHPKVPHGCLLWGRGCQAVT